jgi:hypothetical protein
MSPGARMVADWLTWAVSSMPRKLPGQPTTSMLPSARRHSGSG